MRVSSRDPRLPPLIPPPVNIQIASPVDEDEDDVGPKQDIIDLFQQASDAGDRVATYGQNDEESTSYNTHSNTVINSPQQDRQQDNRRWSHSLSPKHKRDNFNPSIEQQSIFNRMEERYHVRGSNVDEEQYHNNLSERKSSPVVGTRWQQGQGPFVPQTAWSSANKPSRPHHQGQQPPSVHTFDDQFDEFVYKSKHIAHCEPTSSTVASGQLSWEEGPDSLAGNCIFVLTCCVLLGKIGLG